MKIYLFNGLFLLSGALYGQNEDQPIKKWQVGINFSPEITSCHCEGENFDQSELRPKFGSNLQLSLAYKWKKHFSLETGLQYFLSGYGTNIPEGEPNPVYGYSNPSVDELVLYRYVGLPLRINYVAGANKVRFIAGASFSFLYLFGGLSRTTYNLPGLQQILETRGKKNDRFNILPSLSAGIAYQINELLLLRFEPVIRYGILKRESYGYHASMWNAGINIGLYYSIK